MIGKLGRKPRRFDPRVPHMSALRLQAALAGVTPEPPPASIDWSEGMAADLGVMLNNSLGDCTCAAYFHAMQVWSFHANPPMDTEPDSSVQQLYEQACGYNPADASTDQGGDEQSVLSYLVNSGAPAANLAAGRHYLTAFIEVDPRNLTDVHSAIADCGVAYIGFNVPAYLMGSEAAAGDTWDIAPPGADTSIVGGHAVILVGYDAAGNFKVISWGNPYTMTPMFFAQYVDEVYALADPDWIESNGSTPAGLTLAQLREQMAALREPGA